MNRFTIGPVGETLSGNSAEDVRLVVRLLNTAARCGLGLGFGELPENLSAEDPAQRRLLVDAIIGFQKRTYNGWYDGRLNGDTPTFRDLVREIEWTVGAAA